MKKLQQTCRTSGEAGQASIEFVLTISMTLLLIFALIDFSRAMYTASVLQWAAQNGARQAIIDSGQTAVDEAVQERLVGLNLDDLSAAEITKSGNVVQVRVTYTFEFIAPVVAQITGESLELSASASMIAY